MLSIYRPNGYDTWHQIRIYSKMRGGEINRFFAFPTRYYGHKGNIQIVTISNGVNTNKTSSLSYLVTIIGLDNRYYYDSGRDASTS